jgi:NADPH:quinone reductase-like Zn-dependent oxidoreductase
MMRSYVIKVDGGEATLELKEVPRPQPQAHQLLIRVRAAALNRGEFLPGYLAPPAGGGTAMKPLGNEAAGDVVSVGRDIKGYNPGDRVMGRVAGAFSDYVVMDVREAMPVPPSLSWVEAASVPLVYTVVYDMLVAQGHLVADEWLLVVGVSSGVGVAALQMAKALGAQVIGTSGSAAKLERLKSQGLDVALCTRKPDFARAVLSATGGNGVNLVVNAVGGSMFAEAMRTLAYEGRFATVGYVDGITESVIDIATFHTKRLTMFGSSNKLRGAEQRASLVRSFNTEIVPMFADGRLKPLIDTVYPLASLADAKAHMEANRHVGKIVVTVD